MDVGKLEDCYYSKEKWKDNLIPGPWNVLWQLTRYVLKLLWKHVYFGIGKNLVTRAHT